MLLNLICVTTFEYSRGIFSKKQIIEKGEVVRAEIIGSKIQIQLVPETDNDSKETWTKPLRVTTVMYHFEILSKDSDKRGRIFKGLKYHTN